MRLDAFDYDLPEALIAKTPAQPRDHSLLLGVDRRTGALSHRRFHQLDEFLRAGDLLVLNNTRVLPARLFGLQENGRRFEVLLIERRESALHWRCLVRPGKKIAAETRLIFPGNRTAWVRREADAHFAIRFEAPDEAEFFRWLAEAGALPLPPYIKRPYVASDRETYQTVYAKHDGSVAAPTAGLHFTESLLARLREKGVESAELTLHIGYGTFSPIRTDEIEDHELHEESYEIDPSTFARLEIAKGQGRRIIAVGTTSLRTLESIPSHGPRGRTRLFIRPGHPFRWADGLITNFHLPKSSLFVLVASFLGLEATQAAYAEAVRLKYRFFSYGDAMAIL